MFVDLLCLLLSRVYALILSTVGLALSEPGKAVLALVVVSMRQLLGQYFAIADGYWRFQAPAMRPWAERTKIRWRWRGFRFETMFTTPQILLAPLDDDRCSRPLNNDDDRQYTVGRLATYDRPKHVASSPESFLRTFSYASGGEFRSDESAGWLTLLKRLHQYESEVRRYVPSPDARSHSMGPAVLGPAVRFHEISWDFMPRKIVRPFTVMTLCDITVMARRLGMEWKVFNPVMGMMRAEGNGHGLSSTFTRGSGLMLQYIYVGGAYAISNKNATGIGNVDFAQTDFYIPTREADMMSFGILPGIPHLDLAPFKIGTYSDIINTMDYLDGTHEASSKIQDIKELLKDKWDAHCTYGFVDIIPLASPVLRCKGSVITRVPIPAEHCSGLLSTRAGFVTFRNRLSGHLNNTMSALPQAHWVLQQYDGLARRYPSEWQPESPPNTRSNSLIFLDDVHACLDTCTEYLASLQAPPHRLPYLILLAAHLTQAVNWWGDAWAVLNSGTTRDHYGLRTQALEVEGMHMYFDYLPKVVNDVCWRLKGLGAEDEMVEVIYEAWFVMIFRALCWIRCHRMTPDGRINHREIKPLSSRYWDSRLPVFIG